MSYSQLEAGMGNHESRNIDSKDVLRVFSLSTVSKRDVTKLKFDRYNFEVQGEVRPGVRATICYTEDSGYVFMHEDNFGKGEDHKPLVNVLESLV